MNINIITPITREYIDTLNDEGLTQLLEPYGSSYQIADTGDYDAMYIFNGGFSTDDFETALQYLIDSQEFAMPAVGLQEKDKEIENLKVRLDVFAMHMAEVKAISDGSTKSNLSVVVEHCLEELLKLPQ